MNKKRILIAEDAESNYLYLQILLREQYEILHAKDGIETVKMVREEKPDLLLLDIKMPNMDGLEALQQIRAINQTLPIIMQTAYAFESDVETAMKAGATAYLTKPIMKKDLYETIEKYL